jgi:hypothetical protein
MAMARLMNQMMTALREKPARCGYVLCALVLGVVLFTVAEFLPAPYDFGH